MEPTNKSSLPDAWVARIFDKLSLTYGAAWVRKWEGVDGAAVRADWGHELRGFQQAPHAIKHALEHLPPSEPPTVLQFRALCCKAPQYNPPRLAGPPADPATVAKSLEVVKRIGRAKPTLEWAIALREKEKAGAKLSAAVRRMWRDALHEPTGGDELAGGDAREAEDLKRRTQERVNDYMRERAAA